MPATRLLAALEPSKGFGALLVLTGYAPRSHHRVALTGAEKRRIPFQALARKRLDSRFCCHMSVQPRRELLTIEFTRRHLEHHLRLRVDSRTNFVAIEHQEDFHGGIIWRCTSRPAARLRYRTRPAAYRVCRVFLEDVLNGVLARLVRTHAEFFHASTS